MPQSCPDRRKSLSRIRASVPRPTPNLPPQAAPTGVLYSHPKGSPWVACCFVRHRNFATLSEGDEGYRPPVSVFAEEELMMQEMVKRSVLRPALLMLHIVFTATLPSPTPLNLALRSTVRPLLQYRLHAAVYCCLPSCMVCCSRRAEPMPPPTPLPPLPPSPPAALPRTLPPRATRIRTANRCPARFSETVIAPHVATMDKEGELNPEVQAGLFENGLMALEIPEQ